MSGLVEEACRQELQQADEVDLSKAKLLPRPPKAYRGLVGNKSVHLFRDLERDYIHIPLFPTIPQYIPYYSTVISKFFSIIPI